jgi:hypothetical protein
MLPPASVFRCVVLSRCIKRPQSCKRRYLHVAAGKTTLLALPKRLVAEGNRTESVTADDRQAIGLHPVGKLSLSFVYPKAFTSVGRC